MSANASAVRVAPRRQVAPPGPARLAVAWQNPQTRQICPVGLLTWNGAAYGFAYLRRATSEPGFRAFLGFPKFDCLYSSSTLFPLFAQRIMSPYRPDYGRYLQALDLQSSASPWEVLARSEGRREGDSVLVFPEPLVAADGASSARVLVHGIRHRQREDQRVLMSLAQLKIGDRLRLVTDTGNPVNERALLVADNDEVPLGYVPDLLLDYLQHLQAHGTIVLNVARINDATSPPHMRLLVEIHGAADPGYLPFSEANWALVE